MGGPSTALRVGIGGFGAIGMALSVVLVAAACGGDAAPEAASAADPGKTTDPGETAESLAGEGFLALSCAEFAVTVARYSDTDGTVQVQHSYAPELATSATEPRLPHGRVVEDLQSVTLPDCGTEVVYENTTSSRVQLTRNQAHELAGLVIPEQSLLLVEIVERVDGTDVRTIGAMAPDGAVEALLPRGESGGFTGFSDTVSPRYSHNDGTLYYLELHGSGETTAVMSLSLETGAIAEVGPCDESCERIILDPYSGVIYGTIVTEDLYLRSSHDLNHLNRYFSSPDRQTVGYFTNAVAGTIHFHTPGDEVDILSVGAENPSPPRRDDTWGAFHTFHVEWEGFSQAVLPILALSGNELLFEDDAFTVYTFDEEYDIVAERQILPSSTHTNDHPILSADRQHLLFRSTDQAGKITWFSVPVAGDQDPREIGESVHDTMIPIHWF
jgi:hypothetical protein